MEECRLAFKELKKFLASPPLLAKPEVEEELFLYLVTSPEIVSFVLIRKYDKGTQKAIYYTSKILHDMKVRYSKSEKIIFALIIFTRCLRLYFQAYSVVVLTDQPLKAILHWLDTSKRMAKWMVKLNAFDISYHSRSSIKVQVLANFLVECTWIDDKL